MIRRTVRILILFILVAAPSGWAGEDVVLPEVLRRHGFDDPRSPISVVFVGPVGEERDHPRLAGTDEVAPPDTLWVFRDPAPVRKALAAAKTRRFSADRIPGADARIVLYAGPEGAESRIYLNYRPGWGVVKRDRRTGGEWHFDPAADRALVALLSRTPPRAVGHPVRGVVEAAWAKAPEGDGPGVGVTASPVDWARLKARLVTRYATAELDLPKGFSWETHFVAVVWLPARDARDRLDWRGSRLAGDVLRWQLREDREKEEAEGYAPVTIGFFEIPETGRPVFEARVDGRVVGRRTLPGRMALPGDPVLAGTLVLRGADGARAGALLLFADRSWRWEPAGGAGDFREGKVPEEIAAEVYGGLGDWAVDDGPGPPAVEVSRGEGPFPPGTRALLRCLGLLDG